MRSNLPLLFVNGYPTSLSKMSVFELERFIPFMVQCSLGHDKASEFGTPRWWPKEMPYFKAFVKCNKADENWKSKLKLLVQSCYSYHDCNFLLRFCSDLSKHPKSSLRFVNNCDSTTSLFLKNSGKLLVTFRNENILYDKIIPMRKRKWLKPQETSTIPTNALLGTCPSMVEEDPVDIYLCDNCDAVLHSSEEMKEHEEICRDEDISSASPNILDEDQEIFLNYFALSNGANKVFSNKLANKPTTPTRTPIKKKRRENRTNVPHPLLKSASIPFSSPAGILLTKRSRHTVSEQMHTERRERTERYCEAPALCYDTPAWLQEPTVSKSYPINFRKQRMPWVHIYEYPKDVGKYRIDVESQIKYLQCKPSSVKVQCPCKLFSSYTPNVLGDVIDLCSSDDEDSVQEVSDCVISNDNSHT